MNVGEDNKEWNVHKRVHIRWVCCDLVQCESERDCRKVVSCPGPQNRQLRPVPTIVLAVSYALRFTARATSALRQHHEPRILTHRTRNTTQALSTMAVPPGSIKSDPNVSANKWRPTTAPKNDNPGHVGLLTPGQSSPLPAVGHFGASSSGPSSGPLTAPSPFTKFAPAALFVPGSKNANDERRGHADMFE